MTTDVTKTSDWFSEDSATFGDRMAAARAAVGLTQEEFAHRLGVKFKTIQSWENDLNEPRANRLQMMAGLFNVSIRWLLTGEGVAPEEPTEAEASYDFHELLIDLRHVRAQHQQLGETLGKLEKRLRLMRPARGDE